MVIYFIKTHDTIQRNVHQETSYLAARKREDEFAIDDLVMDEEHDELFRRLFNEAKANIILFISPLYIAKTPTDLSPVFAEYKDYRQDRDFLLWLNMPKTFPVQYQKSIDTKIQQYMVDYIVGRWLENKSPNDAVVYLTRLDRTVLEINNYLKRRNGRLAKKPSFP